MAARGERVILMFYLWSDFSRRAACRAYRQLCGVRWLIIRPAAAPSSRRPAPFFTRRPVAPVQAQQV